MSVLGAVSVVSMWLCVHAFATAQRERKQEVCYYCKKPGHWKINCPLLKENGGAGLSPELEAERAGSERRVGIKLQP